MILLSLCSKMLYNENCLISISRNNNLVTQTLGGSKSINKKIPLNVVLWELMMLDVINCSFGYIVVFCSQRKE